MKDKKKFYRNESLTDKLPKTEVNENILFSIASDRK